jgi:hypothetical protein
MARRNDEIAAFRHHRGGDAGRLQNELAAPRVPRAHASDGYVAASDDRPLLRLQMAGTGRQGLRPASLVAYALKTVVAGRCRAYSYVYIHLNLDMRCPISS